MNTFLKIFIIIFATIGFVSFGIIIFHNVCFITSFKADLATDFGSFFGGFVGTIFSILSVILLLYSINIQNKEKSKDDVKNNFFKMLDYHNENVKQLSVSSINVTKNEKSEGRRAFNVFRSQIKELIEVVEEVNMANKYDLSDENVLGIAYMFFYYGLYDDFDKVKFMKGLLKKDYDKEISEKNIDEIVEKTLDKIKLNKKLDLGRPNQTNVNTYFRNMYNAIRLVDENKALSNTEKKDLIKIYRSQLSNPELYVLFVNLMTCFGNRWKKNEYITNYEFIKNLPKDYCGKYEPNDYFPMKYEYEEIGKSSC